MDPLSVAASVAGLVRVTSQLVPALYNLGLTLKEADADAQAAATEVAAMSIVLQVRTRTDLGQAISVNRHYRDYRRTLLDSHVLIHKDCD